MKLSKYQDSDTFWHHKPCVNGKPKSNNGWTYTAYSHYLAPGTIDVDKIRERFIACSKDSNESLIFDRLPDKLDPPMSKDEVIGAVSLTCLPYKRLEDDHWNIANIRGYKKQPLNLRTLYKAIKAYWKNRKLIAEHRNNFWKHEIEDFYVLAFYLPPWDQYYCVKNGGGKPSIFQTIMFYFNFLFTYYKGNKSVRMLLWLQLEDLKHPLLRFIPKNKWVREYFQAEHDFVKGLEKSLTKNKQ